MVARPECRRPETPEDLGDADALRADLGTGKTGGAPPDVDTPQHLFDQAGVNEMQQPVGLKGVVKPVDIADR
jgi:hypothetical protein